MPGYGRVARITEDTFLLDGKYRMVISIKSLEFCQKVWADIMIVSKQCGRCLESFGNQRGDNNRIGTLFDK